MASWIRTLSGSSLSSYLCVLQYTLIPRNTESTGKFSNFVVFSLLGVIYESYLTVAHELGHMGWMDLYKSLGDVPAKITKAYITESSYWLSWYP